MINNFSTLNLILCIIHAHMRKALVGGGGGGGGVLTTFTLYQKIA